jgi:hypothetical protein
MSQHFFLSREARTLSLSQIMRMTDDEARGKHVASGTIIHADESNAWERLHASYDVRRVNQSVEYKAEDGANVNQAESYFSRLRRAEIGQHHRISGSPASSIRERSSLEGGQSPPTERHELECGY